MITNPQLEHGVFVFRTSWEDQKRIAAYNWKAIYLLAAEIERARMNTPIEVPGHKPDSRDYL